MNGCSLASLPKKRRPQRFYSSWKLNLIPSSLPSTLALCLRSQTLLTSSQRLFFVQESSLHLLRPLQSLLLRPHQLLHQFQLLLFSCLLNLQLFLSLYRFFQLLQRP